MTDLDQIALDTVEAIANIDPDKLKGGRLQALAQAQCLVRDALQELEEVGAENYTLTQEVDAALEQVIYWRERAVAAEKERDALASRVDFLNQQNSAQQEQNDELAAHVAACHALMEEMPRRSLAWQVNAMVDLKAEAPEARLKAKWQAEALEWMRVNPYVALNTRIAELRRQAEGGTPQ